MRDSQTLVEVAQAAQESSKRRYESGAADIIELLTAQHALADAHLASLLGGCYSPNQPMLEKEVRNLVQPGMPVSVAVADLSSHGFSCTEEPITCTAGRES